MLVIDHQLFTQEVNHEHCPSNRHRKRKNITVSKAMGGMDGSIYKLREGVLREADPHFILITRNWGAPILK
jgi:hypothetical protein